MTHEVLQSDIDLAKRLINDGVADAQIVHALARRHVVLVDAEQLVRDLHQGRRVSGRIDAGLAAPVSFAEEDALKDSGQERSSSARRPGRVVLAWLGAALLLATLALAGVLGYRAYQSSSIEQPDGGTPAPPRVSSSVAPLSRQALELSPAGLSLAHNLLSPENCLEELRKILGPVTRTNINISAGTTHYLFDKHGILLFAQGEEPPKGLLVDFEAEGGDYSTETAFIGTLRLAGQNIDAQTSTATLMANPQLGLTNSADGILAGKCGEFGLICSFLKTTDRLSLVEIHWPPPLSKK